MRSRGWVAQAHMTFMYWWFNMVTRFKALSAKKWYVRDNPKATGFTAEDLSQMSIPYLAKQMVGYTANIPGTKAGKAKLRRLILAMVKQLEIETRTGDVESGAAGDAVGLGDVPCLFGTLTSQRYHWDGIIRIIAQVEGIDDYKSLSKSKRRHLVNKYPLFVAWYCAVRLELTLKTIVVPIFGASAYVAVFEWSPTGGMVHLHYILWKRGAPRFDIRAENLERNAQMLRKAGLVASGQVHCNISDIVDFFGRYISEWNPNKDEKGEDIGVRLSPEDACSTACDGATDTESTPDTAACQETPATAPELVPPPPPPCEVPRSKPRKRTKGLATCDGMDATDAPATCPTATGQRATSATGLRGGPTIAERIAATAGGVQAEVHTASVSMEEMLERILREDNKEERHQYYKRVVRTEHIHDFHYPDPYGPPNPRAHRGGSCYPANRVRSPAASPARRNEWKHPELKEHHPDNL
jgi:hypothetical protein